MDPSHRTKGTSICGFSYSNLVNEFFGDNGCDLNALSEAYNLEQLPRKEGIRKRLCSQVILSFGTQEANSLSVTFY